MNIRHRFTAWRQAVSLRRIEAARLQLEHVLKTTPRYWRAGQIGNPSIIDLGRVTEAKARKMVTLMGHTIAFVDLDQAFLALDGTISERPPQ